MSRDIIVWVDVETSSLQPDRELVEVGMEITDLEGNFIDAMHKVLFHSITCMQGWDPWCLNTFQKNGLLAECQSAKLSHSTEAVDRDFFQWLSGYDEVNIHPMAGSTVYFDRNTLQEHLPLTLKWFHYRVLDISAIREFFQLKYPDYEWPTDESHHRVTECLEDSIKLYQNLRTNFGLLSS